MNAVATQSCRFFVSTERGQYTVLTATKVVSRPSEKPINKGGFIILFSSILEK